MKAGHACVVYDPLLPGFMGRVSDSGEGRWTVKAAIDRAVPVPELSAALFERSAMRSELGGHLEKAAGGGGS